jgi:hypothetical protein
MGFFRKKEMTAQDSGEQKSRFRPVLRIVLSLVVFCTVAGVTAGGGVLLFKKVWRNVAGLEDFKVDPSTLEVRGLPEWMSPMLADEIKKCADLKGVFSMFEPRVAERIAQAFGKSPWVARVTQVKKEFPNRISMRFAIRRPLAVAKSNGQTYMLDADGVVLSPDLYQWPKDFPAGPPIIPDPSVEMPAPGGRCADPGVQAGIDLLFFLLRNRVDRMLELAAIDVTNIGGRLSGKEPEMVLWASAGTPTAHEGQVRIKWGRPPSQINCGEVSPHEKLANLVLVFKNEGRHFNELDYADIRWDRAYVKYREAVVASR